MNRRKLKGEKGSIRPPPQTVILQLYLALLPEVIAQLLNSSFIELQVLATDFFVIFLSPAQDKSLENPISIDSEGFRFQRVSDIVGMASQGFVYRAFKKLLARASEEIKQVLRDQNMKTHFLFDKHSIKRMMKQGEQISISQGHSIWFTGNPSFSHQDVPPVKLHHLRTHSSTFSPTSLSFSTSHVSKPPVIHVPRCLKTITGTTKSQVSSTNTEQHHLKIRLASNATLFFSLLFQLGFGTHRAHHDDLVPLLGSVLSLRFPTRLYAINALGSIARDGSKGQELIRSNDILGTVLDIVLSTIEKLDKLLHSTNTSTDDNDLSFHQRVVHFHPRFFLDSPGDLNPFQSYHQTLPPFSLGGSKLKYQPGVSRLLDQYSSIIAESFRMLYYSLRNAFGISFPLLGSLSTTHHLPSRQRGTKPNSKLLEAIHSFLTLFVPYHRAYEKHQEYPPETADFLRQQEHTDRSTHDDSFIPDVVQSQTVQGPLSTHHREEDIPNYPNQIIRKTTSPLRSTQTCFDDQTASLENEQFHWNDRSDESSEFSEAITEIESYSQHQPTNDSFEMEAVTQTAFALPTPLQRTPTVRALTTPIQMSTLRKGLHSRQDSIVFSQPRPGPQLDETDSPLFEELEKFTSFVETQSDDESENRDEVDSQSIPQEFMILSHPIIQAALFYTLELLSSLISTESLPILVKSGIFTHIPLFARTSPVTFIKGITIQILTKTQTCLKQYHINDNADKTHLTPFYEQINGVRCIHDLLHHQDSSPFVLPDSSLPHPHKHFDHSLSEEYGTSTLKFFDSTGPVLFDSHIASPLLLGPPSKPSSLDSSASDSPVTALQFEQLMIQFLELSDSFLGEILPTQDLMQQLENITHIMSYQVYIKPEFIAVYTSTIYASSEIGRRLKNLPTGKSTSGMTQLVCLLECPTLSLALACLVGNLVSRLTVTSSRIRSHCLVAPNPSLINRLCSLTNNLHYQPIDSLSTVLSQYPVNLLSLLSSFSISSNASDLFQLTSFHAMGPLKDLRIPTLVSFFAIISLIGFLTCPVMSRRCDWTKDPDTLSSHRELRRLRQINRKYGTKYVLANPISPLERRNRMKRSIATRFTGIDSIIFKEYNFATLVERERLNIGELSRQKQLLEDDNQFDLQITADLTSEAMESLYIPSLPFFKAKTFRLQILRHAIHHVSVTIRFLIRAPNLHSSLSNLSQHHSYRTIWETSPPSETRPYGDPHSMALVAALQFCSILAQHSLLPPGNLFEEDHIMNIIVLSLASDDPRLSYSAAVTLSNLFRVDPHYSIRVIASSLFAPSFFACLRHVSSQQFEGYTISVANAIVNLFYWCCLVSPHEMMKMCVSIAPKFHHSSDSPDDLSVHLLPPNHSVVSLLVSMCGVPVIRSSTLRRVLRSIQFLLLGAPSPACAARLCISREFSSSQSHTDGSVERSPFDDFHAFLLGLFESKDHKISTLAGQCLNIVHILDTQLQDAYCGCQWNYDKTGECLSLLRSLVGSHESLSAHVGYDNPVSKAQSRFDRADITVVDKLFMYLQSFGSQYGICTVPRGPSFTVDEARPLFNHLSLPKTRWTGAQLSEGSLYEFKLDTSIPKTLSNSSARPVLSNRIVLISGLKTPPCSKDGPLPFLSPTPRNDTNDFQDQTQSHLDQRGQQCHHLSPQEIVPIRQHLIESSSLFVRHHDLLPHQSVLERVGHLFPESTFEIRIREMDSIYRTEALVHYSLYSLFLQRWTEDSAQFCERVPDSPDILLGILDFMCSDCYQNEESREFVDYLVPSHSMEFSGGFKLIDAVFMDPQTPPFGRILCLHLLHSILTGINSSVFGYSMSQEILDQQAQMIGTEDRTTLDLDGQEYRTKTALVIYRMSETLMGRFIKTYSFTDSSSFFQSNIPLSEAEEDSIKSLSIVMVESLLSRGYGLHRFKEEYGFNGLLPFIDITTLQPHESEEHLVHRPSLDILRKCLWILAHATKDDLVLPDIMGQSQFVEALLNVLEGPDRSELSCAACCTLSNLMFNNPSNQRRFVEAGHGVSVLASLLLSPLDLESLFHIYSCFLILLRSLPEFIPLLDLYHIPNRAVGLIRQLTSQSMHVLSDYLPSTPFMNHDQATNLVDIPSFLTPSPDLTSSSFYTTLFSSLDQNLTTRIKVGRAAEIQNQLWEDQVMEQYNITVDQISQRTQNQEQNSPQRSFLRKSSRFRFDTQKNRSPLSSTTGTASDLLSQFGEYSFIGEGFLIVDDTLAWDDFYDELLGEQGRRYDEDWTNFQREVEDLNQYVRNPGDEREKSTVLPEEIADELFSLPTRATPQLPSTTLIPLPTILCHLLILFVSEFIHPYLRTDFSTIVKPLSFRLNRKLQEATTHKVSQDEPVTVHTSLHITDAIPSLPHFSHSIRSSRARIKLAPIDPSKR
ncbi:hypothetical protein BLNAU_7390 [Blattamonas nauphoetae]|uniref:HECT-type E3 ubiquitin transferase n=1 Tax=Blattamonas nauphoetae TaxID=2049346 RepID=A0ABQ9Y1W3_9EUKA|nr:hypothetical protein BLNAU_7390 [Blattamonas nauphoetae]